MELRGTTALITGAAKRLGREIALALAEGGANVAVHYNRSAAAAREVVAAIQAKGGSAIAVQADQTDARQVQAAIARVQRQLGTISVLVASAAMFQRTPFETLSERDWDRHLATNLKGPFLFAMTIGRELRRQRKTGKIVLFADWAAMRPYRDYLPYLVSKAGVIGLTKALAVELAPTVQVNAIAPGPVLLPPGFSARQRRRIAAATLLRRLGTPQDVVQSVLYLVQQTDFVTGHVLVVDGGRLLAGAAV